MEEVIIQGETFIGDEPSGYELLQFIDMYLEEDGSIKEGVSLAEMTVDLIKIVFHIPREKIISLKWSDLSKLSNTAGKILAENLQGENQKK